MKIIFDVIGLATIILIWIWEIKNIKTPILKFLVDFVTIVIGILLVWDIFKG